MGQFLDYLASVFTANKVAPKDAHNHVTFVEKSFNQSFGKSSSGGVAALTQSNQKTIYIYQSIGAIAFLIHLTMVAVPKIQNNTFDLLEPDGWQLVTLSLVPLVVYLASIGAMNEINRPLLEGAKLTSKNSGLDLNNNEFIHSLKVVILLMAMCQLSSIFSDQLLWSAVMIVPIWCYQLTSKMAQSEYKRYAPSPKKPWAKWDMSKSPKPTTPPKQVQSTALNEEQVRATPRTRTKRAVKNIINGVTDKYHAFEQNVAHQLSQNIMKPLSPKLKILDS